MPQGGYGALLSRWAGRRARRKLVGRIKLVNILSGDACSPLGFEEFERYLEFQEHSLENLQFIVWYHDYRARFFDLPAEQQALSPSPLLDHHSPTPGRYRGESASPSTTTTADWGFSPTSSSWSQWSPLPPTPVPLRNQPFRTETLHIVATFLRPHAKKELSLDADVRDELLRELEKTTHPDVFTPAYTRIYDLVDTSSVPHFVNTVASNINLPKQIYWYSIGTTFTLLSWLIALFTIYFIPDSPRSKRYIRLVSVPFAVLGCMQIYSAWRGFCSQVFGRSARQLHTWELVDPADAGVSFELPNIASPSTTYPPPPTPPHAIAELAAKTNKRDVAPFLDLAPSSSPFSPSETWEDSVSGPRIAISSQMPARRPVRAAYRRPPVYGPEKVVDDTRVRAYHYAILRDMLWVGFLWGIGWTVLVVGVPGRHTV
ncbi:regulator of G protein signaling domain protein [Ceratobasidium sp. AG-Ba]|nr:regulator of G protein signaling domain protein [Ceratobasidium sp. AG-Ba]